MDIVIFGTGKIYERYRNWFQFYHVIALLDNNPQKQGKLLDGVRIFPPAQIRNLVYDRIFILCKDVHAVVEQLKSLGVRRERIAPCSFGMLGDWDRDVAQEELKNVVLPKACLAPPAERRRLLVITHNFLISGASIVLLQMLRLLREDGYEIFVAAESDGPIRQTFEQAGFPCWVDESLAMNALDYISWLPHVHPDMVLLNTVFVCPLMRSNHLGVPVAWWLHDSERLYASNPCEWLPRQPWLNTHVFAVSESGRTPFVQRCPDWLVGLLPFGVADTAPLPRRVTDTRTREFTFAVIGMLEDRKNQLWAFEALKGLPEALQSRMELLVVYQNEDDVSTVKTYRAAAMGCTSIRFVGRIPREGMDRFYESIDALLCPSKEESMSAVVIEAMMHRKPCIVTRTCGVADFLTDGEDSQLLDLGDTEALRQAMRWMMEHPAGARAMGQAARRTYERNFSLAAFRENLRRTIERIPCRRLP